MTRELPSIPKPGETVPSVHQHAHAEYTTTHHVNVIIGDKIEGGVTLGGVATFVSPFLAPPVVTAVPEVL